MISKKCRPKTSKKSTLKEPSSASKSRAAQIAHECAEWASLRPGMQPEQAIPYCMTGTYRTRDLVQHLSFGLGLVTRQAGPRKIEVLFEEGKKLLCCH